MGNEEFIYYQHHNPEESSAPLTVFQVLSNGCNWRCRHCFLPINETAREFEESLAITQHFVEQGYHVIPAGGEVLLHPEYIGIYSAAHAKHILSNGLVFCSKSGAKLAEDLEKAGIEQVGFTLNTQNNTDITQGVPAEYVRKAMRVVKDAGLIPTATAVVTTANFREIVPLCTTAASYGARAIKFNRMIPTKSDMLPYALSEDDTKRCFDLLEQAKKIVPKDLLEIHAAGMFGLKGREKENIFSGQFCPAGNQMLTLDVDNRIYPCLLLMRPDLQIGEFDPISKEITVDQESLFFRKPYDPKECKAYETWCTPT